MDSYQYTKQLTKTIQADWFGSHEIARHEKTTLGSSDIEFLRWKQPNSGIYWIDYLRKDSMLFVSGDVGEAVYGWHGSSDMSLEWIAGLDISYFHSKCEASEYGGRGARGWDEDVAKSRIFEHFKDAKDCKGLSLFNEEDPPLHDRNEFMCWCSGHDDVLSEITGDHDWWEWLYGCGNVIPNRIISHLVGLKMAFKKT